METTRNYETKHHSWKSGNLCVGCELCVEGRKLVLFITGACPQRCFYCPVSEDKFGSDVVYANEWQIKNPNNPIEMFEEAKLTGAKGAGITGGDPLARLKRTCEYIKLLKEKYGKDFHIHLYTPLALVTQRTLKKLFDAGLDEIRFHPDLNSDKLWSRLLLAKKFDWTVGIEVPCIPGYEQKIKKLIDYSKDIIDFINLNELERSDTTIEHYKLDQMGFKQRSDSTYGIKGSREAGFELIKYCRKINLPVHFCTGKLKDSVQVGNRLKLRAKNVALPYDKITQEGLLLRGVIYVKGLEPGFDYAKRLNKRLSVKELRKLKKLIIEKCEFSDIQEDELRSRFIVPRKELKAKVKELKKLKLVPAFVEEYPTSDAFSVEIDFL